MRMIYHFGNGGLSKCPPDAKVTDSAVWIDLLNPTLEEEHEVEAFLGLDVPTRAEIREIEASNRFYEENGGAFMTCVVMHNIEDPVPLTSTLTFILKDQRLITLRYSEPRSFPIFATRAEKGAAPCQSGAFIMIGILEVLVQRHADLIERIQDEVEKIAQGVFNLNTTRRDASKRLDVQLRKIGKEGDLVSRMLEAAASIDRVLNFFHATGKKRGYDDQILDRITTAHRDVNSIMEHARFLTNRIGFLVEATLGMIATEQNQIIKLFSVMAVMLMPPTLVASIYGMNFEFMPELKWQIGYPLALLTMLVSGILPYIYFRRKGWL
ncbi:MAG: magnesium transporter CorA family protein [Hyphomicrobium sp.]|nr:magnesium transporter CorA family protein [Hyphomicrobium sp.]